jgi:uncharacterized protein YegL
MAPNGTTSTRWCAAHRWYKRAWQRVEMVSTATPDASAWLQRYASQLTAIQRAIELSEGFVLFPVELPGAEAARALGRWLDDRGHPVVMIDRPTGTGWEHLPADLLSIEVKDSGAVLVIGPRLESAAIRSGLRLLNQRRDVVARHLTCPLIWCGSKDFLDLTWRQAPDFWSVADVPRRLGEASPAVDSAEQADARRSREQRAQKAGRLWILVTTSETLALCMRHRIWGRQNEHDIRAYASGDIFLAHVTGGRGIVVMGMFVGDPYYDPTPIWQTGSRGTFPWRIAFVPLGELRQGIPTKEILAPSRSGAPSHWFNGFIQQSHSLTREDFEALSQAFEAALLQDPTIPLHEPPNQANLRIQSANPMHIVLLADNSRSMRGQPAMDATEAVQDWILELQGVTRGKKEYFKFSFITFGSSSEVIASAVNINDVDAATVIVDGNGGSTNMYAALVDACDVIARIAAPHHCPPFVFLFTDGNPDDASAALTEASKLKSLSLPCGSPRIVTLGFGSANDGFLRQVATSPEFYKRVANSRDLVHFLPAIGTPVNRAGGATVGDFERQIAESVI